jgi:heat shock protein HslJ
MEAESRYLSALQDARTIHRQDDELVLEGPDSRLSFAFVTPPPTAELVETDWKLEGLIEGSGPDGSVSSPAAPAKFRMEDDGTFSGTTGCREYGGKWVESSGQIDVTEFGFKSTGVGRCSEYERHQDDLIGGVLGDGFTAEIDERQLTVRALRGDIGLYYRAP